MSKTPPLVSIIVAAPTNPAWLEQTIKSCVEQTLTDIEIILVYGGEVAEAPEHLAKHDERVHVVHATDGSAFETCRAGTLAATAEYVLFVQSGDELERQAIAKIHRSADQLDADLVGFGFRTMAGAPGTESPSGVQRPEHRVLNNVNILRQLFPWNDPLGTRAWAFMFRAELLRSVYAALPSGSTVRASNDLLIVLLALATAETYVSVATPLYRHFPTRAGNDAASSVAELAQNAVKAVDALDASANVIHDWARHLSNPEPLTEAFEASKLASVSRAMDLATRAPAETRDELAAELRSRIGRVTLVMAAAIFAPSALTSVGPFADSIAPTQQQVRSVILVTNVLTTGGVSGVLLSQAQVLLDAGYRVTIAAHRPGSEESMVPEGATLVEIIGSGKLERLSQWAAICREFDTDLVIDHRIMYSRDWPGYAFVANSMDAPTIGWIHAFSGRPTYNGTDLLSLLQENLAALMQLIVLSPLDVVFWKLRGIEHVAYLPNPPSPLIRDSLGAIAGKSAPRSRRLELVWWGRLDESTKKVTQLIEVAVALKRAGTDFRLRIVGPEWNDMTTARLISLSQKKGVENFVEVTGPRHGQSLIDTVDSSDIFINTSIIEGFLLTIPEAQARGLPVVMYDLPWLLPVQDNAGIISVPQGDARALARAVLDLADDTARYEALSQASIDAARRMGEINFADLYQKLVLGHLPTEFSPSPTMESGQQLLDLLIFFAENRSVARPVSKSRAGGLRSAKASPGSPRREAPQSFAAALERRLTSPGQRIIDRAPWLRPIARRFKATLLRVDQRQSPTRVRGSQ